MCLIPLHGPSYLSLKAQPPSQWKILTVKSMHSRVNLMHSIYIADKKLRLQALTGRWDVEEEEEEECEENE